MSFVMYTTGVNENDPTVFATDADIEAYLLAGGPEQYSQDYVSALLDWARHNPAATSSYTIGHGDDRPADVWRYRQDQ